VQDNFTRRAAGDVMTFESSELGKFELVRLATLRTAQLVLGCQPRVAKCGKLTTTALREVVGGKVCRMPGTAAGTRVVAGGDTPSDAPK
jgi:DNA-directed RNA polymerase subunit K/omega